MDFPEFYEILGISRREFKKHKFDIKDTIDSQNDIFFDYELTHEYIIKDLRSPYIKMINDICEFDISYHIDDYPHIRNIMMMDEYKCLSPILIITVYDHVINESNDSVNVLDDIFERLDEHIDKINRLCRYFKKKFKKIFNLFVYEHPINYDIDQYTNTISSTNHFKQFLSLLMELIYEFMNKMIKYYVLRPDEIVRDIIDLYFPLHEIAEYPNELLIV